MAVWLIVAAALIILGVLLYVLIQMPEAKARKEKKRREPPPEPVKDWAMITERLEKRIVTMEGRLQSAGHEIKESDRKIAESVATMEDLRRKYAQEKAWREKEEGELVKEKKQEHVLHEELNKTREELNRESTQRIRQEHELKDLHQVREEQGTQVRKLSAQTIDLDRRLTAALSELKDLKNENFDLRKKKEGEEWVAKSDYRQLESSLKRVRWELEQFKNQFPPSEWPRSLQPKNAQEERSEQKKADREDAVRNVSLPPTNEPKKQGEA